MPVDPIKFAAICDRANATAEFVGGKIDTRSWCELKAALQAAEKRIVELEERAAYAEMRAGKATAPQATATIVAARTTHGTADAT